MQGKQTAQKPNKNKRIAALIAVIILLMMAAMVPGFVNVYRTTTGQSEEIGNLRIETIEANCQRVLDKAENDVGRVAANMEKLLERNASEAEIRSFLRAQQELEIQLSGGSCEGVFCTVGRQVLISGQDAPENYVLQDRPWYRGALTTPKGEVFISPVYQDEFTLGWRITGVVRLSDGRTIVGLHYGLKEIQELIEEMSSDEFGEVLIADADGRIVSYADTSLLGKTIAEALPAYKNIFLRASSGESGESSFAYGNDSTIFCSDGKNGWYVLIKVDNLDLYKTSNMQIWFGLLVLGLTLIVVIVFYVQSYRQRRRAEQALDEKEEFLTNLSDKFHAPLNRILEYGDYDSLTRTDDLQEIADGIREAGESLSSMMDDLFSYSSIRGTENPADRKKRRSERSKLTRRWSRLAVIMVCVVTMFVVIFSTININLRLSKALLEQRARTCCDKVNSWVQEQRDILYMFVNTTAVEPSVVEDYDHMVSYLDNVNKHYPGISAVYIANPDFAHGHQMVMNNGWIPDADYAVETRDWYQGAMTTDDYYLTEPYLDLRTGEYCVSLTKAVYTDDGEFLGVFGLDYYANALTSILDGEDIEDGYVFLADKDGQIIGHPNVDYRDANVSDLPYYDAYTGTDIVRIRDYTGKLSVCTAMEESSSHFHVIMVRDWLSVYGRMIHDVVLIIILFSICIFAVNSIILKMVRLQRETNEQLREAADAALQAGKAKSHFLAQMSHEIRTPINAILGMNEMVLRECEDENILEYASGIQSASNTLLTLINGILDFSKIEDGKMEIIPVNYDVSLLLNDLVNMTAERARTKQLSFVLEIDPKLPQMLFGDDIRIRQVITNLLTNAVKYTASGSVTLRMWGESEEGERNFLLCVEVADTGIGIREEDLENLFNSFQRLDLEKNRNIEGTGLGMSIVQSLLRMMDSELEVESVYNVGSTFRFKLPQKIVSPEPIGDFNQKRRQAIAQRRAQRYLYAPDADVLVVDDNRMNIRVATSLLKRNGIRPDTADSGKECIDCVRKKRYDIIFLDHMMPKMNGIVTLRAMRDGGLLPDGTVVIVMTANAVVGAREEYLSQGFQDYISKPIIVSALEELLAKYLPPEKVSYKNTADDSKKAADSGTAGAPERELGGMTQPVTMVVSPSALGSEGGDSGEELFTKQELKVFHERIPELDVSTGLSYCGDSKDFYLEMLGEYVNSQMADELDGYYAAGDWENYHTKVHALKGSSRTIGATALADQLLQLELAARDGGIEYIRAHHVEAMMNYRSLLEEVRGIEA